MIGIATPSLILAADAAQRRRTERILRDTRRELGEAREQFTQSQKMEAVGQLTGGVAHDFNNLLTVIVGNLNIAQRHLDVIDRGAGGTAAPRHQQRHARRRSGNDHHQAPAGVFAQAAARSEGPRHQRPVHGFSDFLRRTLGETITLDIIAGDRLWQAEADPVQLEAAILNLAVNARDAMAPGGKLTITTDNVILDETYCRHHEELVPGRYVRIAVADTGSGMSPEVLERVFEPFFTTKKAGQGTGLGLARSTASSSSRAGTSRSAASQGGYDRQDLLSRLVPDAREAHGAERERRRCRCGADDPAGRGRSRRSRLCGRNPA